jgi:hypothetical protein
MISMYKVNLYFCLLHCPPSLDWWCLSSSCQNVFREGLSRYHWFLAKVTLAWFKYKTELKTVLIVEGKGKSNKQSVIWTFPTMDSFRISNVWLVFVKFLISFGKYRHTWVWFPSELRKSHTRAVPEAQGAAAASLSPSPTNGFTVTTSAEHRNKEIIHIPNKTCPITPHGGDIFSLLC